MDLVLKFSKVCGTQMSHDTAAISQSLLENDLLRQSFRNCVRWTAIKSSLSDSIVDKLFIEISSKVVNSRLNEMLQAGKEIDLERDGKAVNASQSLRDTLKTYSILKGRVP